MARATSPTVRRRELGALLQRHREAVGLSVTEAAARLGCHPSKISRMESGQRAAGTADVRKLSEIYSIDDKIRDRLVALAREARQHGWWQDYDLESPAFVGLEAAASRLSNFESSIIPGLLQTPDYTTAVVRATHPEWPATQVEQTVEARAIRQTRARENSVELWAILDEAVLHRAIGGAAVMAGQLDQLLLAAAEPNVVVQVIPFKAGAHLALSSTFVLIDFDQSVPSVVFVEGLVGYIYLEKDPDLARYRKALDHLRAIASSPADSLDLVASVRNRHRS